ncbi:MAG: glycosyltransferase, partial [Terriglobales bacterium]
MSALVAAAAAAFVAALAFVLAVWLGYPLVLLACGAWRAHATRSRPRSPVAPAAGPAATLPPLPAPPAPAGFVSLIIAAHNEAAVIPARLANLAALDYPRDQVEVIVVEDGSVDGTAAAAAAAAAALAEHCPPLRVRVLSAPERQGKAAALNRAVAAAAGTILVFSDANNGFAADALRRLLAPLQDTRVGAVAGWKTVAADCGVGGGESVYWRFERWLMEREDRLGWVVNAAGEVLAMRRECFRPLPMGAVLNDDLFFALSVRAQGRRVAFAPAARSFEPPAANGGEEWRRRRRIAAGRWRALRA